MPGFWVFSLWNFPRFGKLYVELSDAEKESLNDHWAQLKRLVQDYVFRRDLTARRIINARN